MLCDKALCWLTCSFLFSQPVTLTIRDVHRVKMLLFLLRVNGTVGG